MWKLLSGVGDLGTEGRPTAEIILRFSDYSQQDLVWPAPRVSERSIFRSEWGTISSSRLSTSRGFHSELGIVVVGNQTPAHGESSHEKGC